MPSQQNVTLWPGIRILLSGWTVTYGGTAEFKIHVVKRVKQGPFVRFMLFSDTRDTYVCTSLSVNGKYYRCTVYTMYCV